MNGYWEHASKNKQCFRLLKALSEVGETFCVEELYGAHWVRGSWDLSHRN